MKKWIPVLLFLCASAQASSNVWNSLSTTLTLSYESRYVLYGYNQGQHLYHADLSFWLPISDRLSVWAGSWYGTRANGTYNEADFYTGVDFQLSDHLSAGLAYALFNYIEVPFPTSKQAHEYSGHLTVTAGPLSLSLRDLYDTEGQGHLARAVASFDRPLTDTAGLSLTAEYGYSFDYFETGQGPNHALFKAALPVQLNSTFSVQPFIAHSLALDAIDAFERDRTYGGISLTASF
jgi:hypothetical protein